MCVTYENKVVVDRFDTYLNLFLYFPSLVQMAMDLDMILLDGSCNIEDNGIDEEIKLFFLMSSLPGCY